LYCSVKLKLINTTTSAEILASSKSFRWRRRKKCQKNSILLLKF